MTENITEQLNNIQSSLIKVTPNNGVKIVERPQNKNLKPFKKGENGGYHRTKGALDYNTIREMAIRKLGKETGKTDLEIDVEIQAQALLQAHKGNFSFYKDDKDRVHGQAVSRNEIGGIDGGTPIKLELGLQRALDNAYGEENDTN